MYNIFFNKKEKIKLVEKEVYLRYPKKSDWKEWAELRQKSRQFLQPWEPTWPKNYLTKESFENFVDHSDYLIKKKSGYTFFIFHKKKNNLMGGISLSNLKNSLYQSITMGYWMGEEFSGKGYMKDSIKIISKFCFEKLGLNRIEAACLPNNHKSKKVLISSKFEIEGYARKYLQINGAFEDHILFSKIKKDF